MGTYKMYSGDCLKVMKDMPNDSIDSIITDPPYGISFMKNEWDHGVPGKKFWEEMLRVSKPGSNLFSFGGTKTFHRLMVSIEDAGWEIRDTLMWIYTSGLPKNMDVSKAVEAQRLFGGSSRKQQRMASMGFRYDDCDTKGTTGKMRSTIGGTTSNPASSINNEWYGWGTALKPAYEPIILARKPLIGTIAVNVLQHNTGGINIDACMILTAEEIERNNSNNEGRVKGRWPANIIQDGSDEIKELFQNDEIPSRFFYTTKATRHDRDVGVSGKNTHPTVKPTDLMRYICRMSTPKNGTILDPFAGSGSTGKAAILEGFNFIGIEKDEEFLEIAKARLENSQMEYETKR